MCHFSQIKENTKSVGCIAAIPDRDYFKKIQYAILQIQEPSI